MYMLLIIKKIRLFVVDKDSCQALLGSTASKQDSGPSSTRSRIQYPKLVENKKSGMLIKAECGKAGEKYSWPNCLPTGIMAIS